MSSAKKSDTRPRYPSLASVLVGQLKDLKAGLLVALFIVYVVHHPAVLPAFLVWARDSPTVGSITAWMTTTLPQGNLGALDVLLLVALTNGIHSIMYFVLNGFFLACDVNGWLKRYKLPRAAYMRLDWSLIKETWKEALIGQTITGPFTLFLLITYPANFSSFFLADGVTPAPAPPLLSTFGHITAAMYFNEFFFYIAHRAFHEVPYLYQKFHKQHHRYIGTIGFAAEFAHPVEQIFANQLPTIGYCVLMSSHITPSIWLTWLAFRLWETYEAHSGYHFEETPLGQIGLLCGKRAEWHDYHHSANKGNYGSMFFDYLGGSMDSFLEYKASQQQQTTTGIKKSAE